MVEANRAAEKKIYHSGVLVGQPRNLEGSGAQPK